MANYKASAKIDISIVTVEFSTHLVGCSSQCSECEQHFLAERLKDEPNFKFGGDLKSDGGELARTLQVLLFPGRLICPSCQNKLCATHKINLIRTTNIRHDCPALPLNLWLLKSGFWNFYTVKVF